MPVSVDASVFRYRDLMLSVLFTGREGLSIIGEIQLHVESMYPVKVGARAETCNWLKLVTQWSVRVTVSTRGQTVSTGGQTVRTRGQTSSSMHRFDLKDSRGQRRPIYKAVINPLNYLLGLCRRKCLEKHFCWLQGIEVTVHTHALAPVPGSTLRLRAPMSLWLKRMEN
eukprot:3767883-Rhodomonas_salina.1